MEHKENAPVFGDDIVSQAAASAFGIRYLYPMQRLVIANILDAAGTAADGESPAFARQIVLLPTGAGKSFCFLVPALLLDGPTLVVYPLLSLMADQKRKLDAAGIPCAVLAGGQGREAREREMRRIEDGTARVIITNPETLRGEQVLARLASLGIAHVAVDEAHCVGDWGDSFRPAYLELGRVIDRLRPRVATAFTATASGPVLERIQEVLFGGEAYVVRGDADRPNIRYSVTNCLNKRKEALRLSATCPRPMIVFCGTRYKAEDMAKELAALHGRESVRFYHAGMEKEERKAVEDWFFSSDGGMLCATCAYGMGVDKGDVRTIVHLESPSTVEEYMQESGRAGRDGKASSAILLWSPDDSRRFSRFAADSREGRMLRYARAGTCRRQILLEALGCTMTACSGCDVCERGGGESPFAADGSLALSFIRRHRKLYDRDSLSSELIRLYNRAWLPLLHVNVWAHSDVDQVLDALESEGRIRLCRFPWKGRVADCKGPRKLLE